MVMGRLECLDLVLKSASKCVVFIRGAAYDFFKTNIIQINLSEIE